MEGLSAKEKKTVIAHANSLSGKAGDPRPNHIRYGLILPPMLECSTEHL